MRKEAGRDQLDGKAEKNTSLNGNKSAELSGQRSQYSLAKGHPHPCDSQKTSPVSASLSTGIFRESEVTAQTQVHIHHITHVPPRLLKLGNDSTIIHHYSYFQGCE